MVVVTALVIGYGLGQYLPYSSFTGRNSGLGQSTSNTFPSTGSTSSSETTTGQISASTSTPTKTCRNTPPSGYVCSTLWDFAFVSPAFSTSYLDNGYVNLTGAYVGHLELSVVENYTETVQNGASSRSYQFKANLSASPGVITLANGTSFSSLTWLFNPHSWNLSSDIVSQSSCEYGFSPSVISVTVNSTAEPGPWPDAASFSLCRLSGSASSTATSDIGICLAKTQTSCPIDSQLSLVFATSGGWRYWGTNVGGTDKVNFTPIS